MVESLVQLGADVDAAEQCGGRTSLHLAVDLQNATLVGCLLGLGADANRSNYGGFTPYHLTYGRSNQEIRRCLYERTAHQLRELPDSESDDSDMEEAELSEDEVSSGSPHLPSRLDPKGNMAAAGLTLSLLSSLSAAVR